MLNQAEVKVAKTWTAGWLVFFFIMAQVIAPSVYAGPEMMGASPVGVPSIQANEVNTASLENAPLPNPNNFLQGQTLSRSAEPRSAELQPQSVPVVTTPSKPSISLPGNAANGVTLEASTSTIQWTHSTGSLDHYEISLKKKNGSAYTLNVPQPTSTTNSLTLSSLMPGDYQISVRACAPSGATPCSAFSTARTFFILGESSVSGLAGAAVSGAQVTATDRTPQITWQSVAGANLYDVQILDAQTNEPRLTKTNLTGLTYTLAFDERLWGGSYKIQVRAHTATTTGVFGQVYMFTLNETAPVVPAKPTVASTTPQAQPVFTWVAQESAKTYHVVILKKQVDGTFQPTGGLDVPNFTTNSYQITQTLTQGDYQIKVSSVNGAGTESVFSPFLAFSAPAVPILNGPTGMIATPKPTITWSAVTGLKYDIKIYQGDSTVPMSITPQPMGLSGGSYTLPQDLPVEGNYHVRIRAKNTVVASDFSASCEFTFQSTPPAKPVLTGPAQTVFQTNARPQITWSAVTGAVKYTLAIMQNGTQVVAPITVTGTSFTPAVNLASGSYQVVLTAVNKYDRPSTANTAALLININKPVLTAQIFTAYEGVSQTLTLGPSKDGDNQLISYAGTTLSANLQANGTVTINGNQLIYTPKAGYVTAAVGEIITVKASDGLETVTTAITLKIQAPAAPAKPVASTTVLGFTWPAVAGAQTYKVLIEKKQGSMFGPVPGFNFPINVDTNTYQQMQTLPQGDYRISVQAVSVQTASAYSPVFTFSAPAVPSLTGPANLSTISASKPTITWNAVTGLKYDIQIFSGTSTVPMDLGSQVATGLTGGSFTLAQNLPAEGSYRVRIRAASGVVASDFTERVFNFQSTPPAVPVLTGPSPSAFQSTARPQITWNAAAGAASYSLRIVDTQATPNQDEINTIVTGTSFTPSVDLDSGHYQVILTAVNMYGHESTTNAQAPLLINRSRPVFEITSFSGYEGVRKTIILGPARDAEGHSINYTVTLSGNLANNGSLQKIGNQITYIPRAGYTTVNSNNVITPEIILVEAADDLETVTATLKLIINPATLPSVPSGLVVDPLIGSLPSQAWWLDDIHARRAWNITRGAGVNIAVVDTGVDTNHPELAGQIFTNNGEASFYGLDGVNTDHNFRCLNYLNPAACDAVGYQPSPGETDFVDDLHGWDFVNNNNNANPVTATQANWNDYWDGSGFHGTHVAGIIAADDNNGVGFAGIAPASQIIPVQVYSGLNSVPSGYWNQIMDGILYAAQMGADVINLSLGGAMPDSQTLEQLRGVINYVTNVKKAIIVASSGNDNTNGDDQAPAALDNVISVGAIDQSHQRAEFSNYGRTLDFVAPGANIYSTIPTAVPSLTLDGTTYPVGYLAIDGTSMAAPMVSGIIGLMAAQMKAWLMPTGTAHEFTYADAMRRLQYSSLDLGAAGRDDYYGMGIVDAFRALSYDYYDDGRIKTQWLERADENRNTRLDFDRSGRLISGNVSGLFS